MVAVNISEAQNNLRELIAKAQYEPVSIVQNGQPSAFLISEREMEALQTLLPVRGSAALALEHGQERRACSEIRTSRL